MSEFDQLLDYLESYNNKKLFKKPENKQVEEKVDKVKPENQIALNDVKIEDYKNLHSDVRSGFSKTNFISSNGFDIDKFHRLCNDKLRLEFEAAQNYERPYFSVTELIQCVRLTYFQRMKYKVDINSMFTYGNLLLIQEVGKEIHNIVQNIYEFEDVEKVVIDEDFKVKGRLDALTNNIVYEIKTIDDEKYKNTYEQKHFIQGCIYSYILNQNFGKKIDTITIIYFPRSLKKIYSFDVEYNKNIALKYLNNAVILKNSIENKKVPKESEIGTESCKYCSYKKYCENVNEIPIKKNQEETVFLI